MPGGHWGMMIDEQRSTESPTEGPEIFRHDVSSLAVLATLVIMAGGGDRLASGQATDPDSNPIMDRINPKIKSHTHAPGHSNKREAPIYK